MDASYSRTMRGRAGAGLRQRWVVCPRRQVEWTAWRRALRACKLSVLPLWWLPFALAGVALVGRGQSNPAAGAPFTLSWTEGKCVGCRTAKELGRTRFVGRGEAWAVGCAHLPSRDCAVVHTITAGRIWTELPRTLQPAGDPVGPPAFSFLDAARGWIASWDLVHEPNIISTSDGGKHWQEVSHNLVQQARFFDDKRGCGTQVTKFKRTNDGGRTWTEIEIPHVRFIDRMVFISPERGWLAGTDEKSLYVFRTSDGGLSWEESRTAVPKGSSGVEDLFFLDQNRGWVIAWPENDGGSYLLSTVNGGKSWVPEADFLFQGKGNWPEIVRFVDEQRGYVFVEAPKCYLSYTTDGGAHWGKQAIPRFLDDCQVFEGDLLCACGPGFGLLTLHPK